jgi:hypothetical protein
MHGSGVKEKRTKEEGGTETDAHTLQGRNIVSVQNILANDIHEGCVATVE